MGESEFDRYASRGWTRFLGDPGRAAASLGATEGVRVTRLLDAGCGGGYEMLPFVERGGFGVGIDVSPDVGRGGRQAFADRGLGERVAFVRAAAEALPFVSGAFDLVICRLVLPYTDNALALAEFARVLRARGVLLLKVHFARYYLNRLGRGLLSLDLRAAIHASRVLVAGAVYHLTGRQPRTRIPSPETFQSRWLLRRELARLGLRIRDQMPGSPPDAPAFVVERASGASASG